MGWRELWHHDLPGCCRTSANGSYDDVYGLHGDVPYLSDWADWLSDSVSRSRWADLHGKNMIKLDRVCALETIARTERRGRHS